VSLPRPTTSTDGAARRSGLARAPSRPCPDRVRIRSYDDAGDRAAVRRLWEVTRGERWPIDPAALRRVLADDGQPIGFVATQARGERGGILLVLVDPAERRRGVGRALHDRSRLLRE
jgi:GNAT superfamily N-acetyltransferase